MILKSFVFPLSLCYLFTVVFIFYVKGVSIWILIFIVYYLHVALNELDAV